MLPGVFTLKGVFGNGPQFHCEEKNLSFQAPNFISLWRKIGYQLGPQFQFQASYFYVKKS